MTKFKLTVLLLFLTFTVFSQDGERVKLEWKTPIQYGLEGQLNQRAITFEDAQYDFAVSNLPFFIQKFNGKVLSNLTLQDVVVEPLSYEEVQLIDKSLLTTDFIVESNTTVVQKVSNTVVKIIPLRISEIGQVEKLTSFHFKYSDSEKAAMSRLKRMNFASQSKLATGNWYKIAVTEEKVFKLSRRFLSDLGMDVENLDPRKIKIYGYGGGMLPEANSAPRPDDLLENPIVVAGEQDGSFDASDYVLFYGDDQVEWAYDSIAQFFRHSLNRFSDTTFYFINAEGENGKRISEAGVSSNSATAIITEFDNYNFHEVESTNLLKSGSLWIGELFDNNTNQTFDINFNNTILTEPAKVEMSVLARSGTLSKFTLSVNGQSFDTEVGSTNLSRYEFRFAQVSRKMFQFTPNQGVILFNLDYNKPQVVSKGWLNYLSVNLRAKLNMSSNQLNFRDVRSVDSGNPNAEAVFQFPNTANLKVWDVTDIENIQAMSVQSNGNVSSFQNKVAQLREYIAFTSADSVGVYAKGQIPNQNLHGLPQADMLIISHDNFTTAAERLADIHRSEGLLVNVVSPREIFNEYSSGAQDLIAMRSFIKMFYDRASTGGVAPKYVLMMGDASYVFKSNTTNGTNYVPSFQSSNSIDPVNSHVSDDYFGLLDDSEGLWRVPSTDRMDVAIGRFPVQTLQEANGIVDKVEAYYSSAALKDWRNQIVFVGDDEDGVVHMAQSNDLSKLVDQKGKDFNTQKIFLDAYQQQATASGARYPQVTEELVQTVEDGALFVNYTGHGGETGWTAERVLGIFEISNWTNKQSLPVFITATCEFSRFDDPLRTSGGELLLLNPNGGGIGLMTTTRLVFSSPNYLLHRSFYDKVFEPQPNGEPMRLGDIFLDVKNFNAYSSNSRNFSLLGDPAIRLAIPKETILTTAINGVPIAQADTLNALSQVTISGVVADDDGTKLTNFNGVVYPTVFDKVEVKKTLNNDGGGVFTFETRERRIFKGKATVTNGDFSFTFVVPKDISYSYGSGKISYYAENQIIDANGYTESIVIGGSNQNLSQDDQGPEMELYLNDENFVYGGVTDENPRLLLNLRDDQGINTVGSGIGHDIVATLDGNSENSFILNDFYEAAIDDHTQGVVSFPFTDLSPGKHSLKVKAWDVANNSSERTIEFTVVKDQEVKIENLVNYPNPFTTNTEFIFQHNQAGVVMDVKVEIYTVSGRLVKSIDQMIVSEGFVSKDIRWDGRDDFGDKIGKGVYMYKLTIRSANGSSSEKIEKLVIL